MSALKCGQKKDSPQMRIKQLSIKEWTQYGFSPKNMEKIFCELFVNYRNIILIVTFISIGEVPPP